MAYYLCVDCGGSKTAAAIADADGNIIARGTGGPSNVAYLGVPNFLQAVSSTVVPALASISPTLTLPPPPSAPIFAGAWFGVSGADSAAAIARLIQPLHDLLGVEPIVANDTHLLAAPLEMHDDVSAALGCVSGTGGIVVSFRQHAPGDKRGGLEELGRVGGWGWILGDEGGGFHVGREAVRAILWEADRASVLAPADREVRTASTLRTRVMAHFALEDVFDILTVVHEPDPPPVGAEETAAVQASKGLGKDRNAGYLLMAREKRLSSLAPLVFAAAFEDKDRLALQVLRDTSSMLVDQMCVLLRPEEDDGKEHGPRTIKASETILCFGGSLVGVEAYRKMILEELERRGHKMKRWEFVDDVSGVGAKALALAGKGR